MRRGFASIGCEIFRVWAYGLKTSQLLQLSKRNRVDATIPEFLAPESDRIENVNSKCGQKNHRKSARGYENAKRFDPSAKHAELYVKRLVQSLRKCRAVPWILAVSLILVVFVVQHLQVQLSLLAVCKVTSWSTAAQAAETIV